MGKGFLPTMCGQADDEISEKIHHLCIPWLLNYIINIFTFNTNGGLTLWVSEKAQQCDTIAMSSSDIVVNISNRDV